MKPKQILHPNSPQYNDITKESDLPLNAHFITDVDTEGTYLHLEGINPLSGDNMYHMLPVLEKALVFNKDQAKYLIDRTEQNNKLKPVLCSEIFKKNKSDERKTNK